MYLNVKSAFITLFLISLMYTCCEVNATAIPKIEERGTDCGGFSFDHPPAEGSKKKEIVIMNSTTLTSNWTTQAGSDVDYVIDFELFTSNGSYLGILWNIGAKMTNHLAVGEVEINVPENIKLPATFLARSWANTTSGSHCIALTYALCFIISN
ncbi:6416_t:CDS:2 [Cetraspora pellucida]|uniref:6416_t:CDS:1 n=1 Tax=Cetraspora pellucida TaxID=1433469 RepID=A0A9N8W7P5_9GLOM|nr:6416_t:CDS:2 [Cetraspora pellucida]